MDAREMVGKLQWNGFDVHGVRSCPICGEWAPYKEADGNMYGGTHAKNCVLAALLKEAPNE